MAEVASSFLLQPGDAAPDFDLPRPSDGGRRSLASLRGQPLLLVFACNHCPFVVHLAEALGRMAREFAGRVNFVAINPNDVGNYPADAPERMPGFQAEHGWDFDYLFDESQQVARAYGAECTPDFFLFDAELKLRWAGQFDDSRPRGKNLGEPSGADLRAALVRVLAGKPVPQPWKAATGCSIKWRR